MLSRIKSIENLELEGRRVLIRADLNCPVTEDGIIIDDSRLVTALPTIQLARQRGAKVIICSHLGRPKGRPRRELSMLGVGERLAELLKTDIFLPDDCIGDGPRKLAMNLRDGQVILLENVRFHKGEAKNDDAFARGLAALAQVYVNDALGCAHRAHASVVAVPRLVGDRAAGKLLIHEVESLQRFIPPAQGLVGGPAPAPLERPFVLALGGASVASRIGVVDQLLGLADTVLIGGAMASTFLRAQGIETGRSAVDEERLDRARRVLLKAEAKGVRIVLPSDHSVVTEVSPDAPVKVRDNGHVAHDELAVDIGPRTAAEFAEHIEGAGTVLWSGPMGVYEHEAFARGTLQVAQAVAKARTSVVIGGDSALALRKAGVTPFVTHLSTGGGAALELLEGKELPGLEALRQSRRSSDVP